MSDLPLLDVGGVAVEPMIVGEVVVLRGTIPPGRAVPLHTHPDPETFYLISGTVEGLVISSSEEVSWAQIEHGGAWHVPPDLRHGWRNPADEPAVLMLMTTPNLGEWFLEAGTPLSSLDQIQWPPSEKTLARMFEAAARHSLWLASPEENATVGISMGA